MALATWIRDRWVWLAAAVVVLFIVVSQRHWIFWTADRVGHQVFRTGWWTSDHTLALANACLAVIALAAILVSRRATRLSLERSDRQLELSRDALSLDADAFLASTQPIIIEPHSPVQEMMCRDNGHGGIDVRVSMRNMGRGPAFIREAHFTPGRVEPTLIATAHNAVLPVNETTTVFTTVNGTDHMYPMINVDFPREFAVAINYDDISGEQRTRSVMRILQTNTHEFTVLDVGLYHCDENWRRDPTPFAGKDRYAGDIGTHANGG